jgi:hypothetical protein
MTDYEVTCSIVVLARAARIKRSLGFAISSPLSQRAVRAVNADYAKAGRRAPIARRRST